MGWDECDDNRENGAESLVGVETFINGFRLQHKGEDMTVQDLLKMERQYIFAQILNKESFPIFFLSIFLYMLHIFHVGQY